MLVHVMLDLCTVAGDFWIFRTQIINLLQIIAVLGNDEPSLNVYYSVCFV